MGYRRATGIASVLLALLGATSAIARSPPSAPAATQPRFANIFGDHAVLQRDRPITVWGTAPAGARLTLRLHDRRVAVTAAADGTWRAVLPALPAGGPYVLALHDGAGTAVRELADVMVGDVFLCSGQSNMEFKVREATGAWGAIGESADPALRFATIADASRTAPAADFDAPVAWRQSAPDTIGEASAVCYFMAKSLRATEKVPIGFVSSEWGGTRIESWMSAAALGAMAPFRDRVAAVAAYDRDPAAAIAAYGAQRDAWWRANDPAAASQRSYRDAGFDDGGWPTIPTGPWKQAGVPALAAFDGAVWLRTTIDLTAEQAAAARTLQLGPIDQHDETWVNGRFVGGSSVGWSWRKYGVSAGTLRAGRNVIAIRVLGGGAGGGFTGAAPRGVELADGTIVPFTGDWRYRVGTAMTGKSILPAPWDIPNSLTTLYNGMIAPLKGYGFKLAAWYQGESNTGEAGQYRALMSSLMADWRRNLSTPDLPFLIVQLPGYGTPATKPGPSGWAELRQAEAQAVAADAHAGLVVTIDAGDRFDIHPTQKKVVGDRAARIARVVAYRQPGLDSGPEAQAVTRSGNDLTIAFRNVTDGLRTYSGAGAIGFELCSATGCDYADARVTGQGVTLAGANRPGVTSVRYAWADAPFVNLFDGADLPVAPFTLPVR